MTAPGESSRSTSFEDRASPLRYAALEVRASSPQAAEGSGPLDIPQVSPILTDKNMKAVNRWGVPGQWGIT